MNTTPINSTTVPKWASSKTAQLITLDTNTIETGFEPNQLITAQYINAALVSIIQYAEGYANNLASNLNTSLQSTQTTMLDTIKKSLSSYSTTEQVTNDINNVITDLITTSQLNKVKQELQDSINKFIENINSTLTELQNSISTLKAEQNQHS